MGFDEIFERSFFGILCHLPRATAAPTGGGRTTTGLRTTTGFPCRLTTGITNFYSTSTPTRIYYKIFFPKSKGQLFLYFSVTSLFNYVIILVKIYPRLTNGETEMDTHVLDTSGKV